MSQVVPNYINRRRRSTRTGYRYGSQNFNVLTSQDLQPQQNQSQNPYQDPSRNITSSSRQYRTFTPILDQKPYNSTLQKFSLKQLQTQILQADRWPRLKNSTVVNHKILVILTLPKVMLNLCGGIVLCNTHRNRPQDSRIITSQDNNKFVVEDINLDAYTYRTKNDEFYNSPAYIKDPVYSKYEIYRKMGQDNRRQQQEQQRQIEIQQQKQRDQENQYRIQQEQIQQQQQQFEQQQQIQQQKQQQEQNAQQLKELDDKIKQKEKEKLLQENKDQDQISNISQKKSEKQRQMEEYNAQLEKRTEQIKKILNQDQTKGQKMSALEELYQQYKDEHPELQPLELLKYKKLPNRNEVKRPPPPKKREMQIQTDFDPYEHKKKLIKEFKSSMKMKLQNELKKMRGEMSLQNYAVREQLLQLQTEAIANEKRQREAINGLNSFKSQLLKPYWEDEAFNKNHVQRTNNTILPPHLSQGRFELPQYEFNQLRHIKQQNDIRNFLSQKRTNAELQTEHNKLLNVAHNYGEHRIFNRDNIHQNILTKFDLDPPSTKNPYSIMER